MSIKDVCGEAISKGELCQFLRGDGEYNIVDHEGLSHDYSKALVEGVYSLYQEFNNTKIFYENTLKDMIDGQNLENLLYAYNYLSLQIKMEKNGFAPFELSADLYKDLSQKIKANGEALKNFKKIPEFGSGLPNGSYEFIQNMENIMEDSYGKRTI